MNAFRKLLCKMFGIGCEQPAPPSPPSTTPVPPQDLLFGYYAGGDVKTFADHCNVLFIGSWGDWVSVQGRSNITNTFIQQIEAAKNNGIARVMIVLDWCVFTPQFKLLPEALAVQYLTTFFNALEAANCTWPVVAVYPVDEPDVQGINTADMTTANALIRVTMAQYGYLKDKPLAVTYGVNGTPAISTFDWCGFDNYGAPIFTDGEYDSFVAKLRPEQRTIIVPGGGDPWKQDPTPFAQKAASDPRVKLIMPFMWFDNGGNKNIETNGMAPAYRAVGFPIKQANP